MDTTTAFEIPYVDPGDPQREFPPLNQRAMEIIDAALFEQAGAIQDLDAAIGTTETAITAERAARETAILAEQTARQQADTALTTSISQEADTRAQADTDLTTSISQEAATRAQADTDLTTSISQEAATRAQADTALTTALAGKVTGTGMTLRHDTTVGTRVLLDRTGGTTMLSGDTGWRNVSGSLLNGWTGILHIRRNNATILARAVGLNGSAATSDTIYALPTGFIDTTWRDIPVYDAVENKTLRMQMQPGEIKLPKRATPYFSPGYTEIVIARIDPAIAWPTTQPGIPA